jgi:hypothetical protein
MRSTRRKALVGALAAIMSAAGVIIGPATPSVAAQSAITADDRPLLRVPFNCGETWRGETREGHSPSYWAMDFNWGSGDDDLGKVVKTSGHGTVLEVGVANDGVQDGYGNYILIGHGNGWRTRYAHLRTVYVSRGQSIGDSNTIGLVGKTGNVTAAHLHYEQIHNGVVVAIKFGTSTWATYPGPDYYERIRDC